MIERFLSNPSVLQQLRDGPLGSYVDRFASRLSEQGYARSTAKNKLRLLADFSQWIHRQQLRVDELNEQRIIKFLKYRRKKGRVRLGNMATLQSLLEQLPVFLQGGQECGMHLYRKG